MSRVILYPVPVQGEQAAEEIARAIQVANQRRDCDVLLLIRGGGSLEDLWCFNDEKLARAIADSELPIVSGVGHEIDYTIADFAADLRAPTPSVAAETVTADQYELMTRIDRLQARLIRLQRETLKQQGQQLAQLAQRLRGRLCCDSDCFTSIPAAGYSSIASSSSNGFSARTSRSSACSSTSASNFDCRPAPSTI